VTQGDPTDHALATIASILEPESRRESEKGAAAEPRHAVPPPLPATHAPIEAHGYSKHGPGPMAAIRFKWTVRLDNSHYFVDETIGENSAPFVSGPVSREAAIQMTLTAPGCGMGHAISMDAKHRIEGLPGVAEADVEVVWEPPWNPHMISPEGRAKLGME